MNLYYLIPLTTNIWVYSLSPTKTAWAIIRCSFSQESFLYLFLSVICYNSVFPGEALKGVKYRSAPPKLKIHSWSARKTLCLHYTPHSPTREVSSLRPEHVKIRERETERKNIAPLRCRSVVLERYSSNKNRHWAERESMRKSGKKRQSATWRIKKLKMSNSWHPFDFFLNENRAQKSRAVPRFHTRSDS